MYEVYIRLWMWAFFVWSQLGHFRKATGSALQEAMGTWAEMWKRHELRCQMMHGALVSPEVEESLKPLYAGQRRKIRKG